MTDMNALDQKALEAACASFNPNLFGDNPTDRHFAATPYTVEAAQRPIRQQVEAAITAYIAVAEAVEPVAWLHTIQEPDVGQSQTMYSGSPDNPWSHWLEGHRDQCVYTCTPLFASPPPASSPVEPSNLQIMQSAPEGWVLVPREPSAAALAAGMDDLGWWVEPYEAPRESGVPVDSDMSAEDAALINDQQLQVVASCYRSMIAASPPSPVPSPVTEVTDAMVASAEAAVYPRHERGFLLKPLIDPIDMRAALTAALTPDLAGKGDEP